MIMKIKKWMAFLLVMLMVAGMLPMSAGADDTTPNMSSKACSSGTNPFVPAYSGQCTAFVWGRTYEKPGIKLPTKKDIPAQGLTG